MTSTPDFHSSLSECPSEIGLNVLSVLNASTEEEASERLDSFLNQGALGVHNLELENLLIIAENTPFHGIKLMITYLVNADRNLSRRDRIHALIEEVQMLEGDTEEYPPELSDRHEWDSGNDNDPEDEDWQVEYEAYCQSQNKERFQAEQAAYWATYRAQEESDLKAYLETDQKEMDAEFQKEIDAGLRAGLLKVLDGTATPDDIVSLEGFMLADALHRCKAPQK